MGFNICMSVRLLIAVHSRMVDIHRQIFFKQFTTTHSLFSFVHSEGENSNSAMKACSFLHLVNIHSCAAPSVFSLCAIFMFGGDEHVDFRDKRMCPLFSRDGSPSAQRKQQPPLSNKNDDWLLRASSVCHT